MDSPDAAYWDERAEALFVYKGQELYTATPGPLYLKRRELLLDACMPLLSADSVRRICDFGCGDGWYVSYFGERLEGKRFWGVDIAPQMISLAREHSPDATFTVSAAGIPFDEDFDLIYCFAVLAHVPDELAAGLVRNMAEHLSPKGALLLFEATGPLRESGKDYTRRISRDYEDYAAAAGLQVERRTTISFPLFNLYQRTLLRGLKLLCRGRTRVEKRRASQQSRFINRLSELVLSGSGSGIGDPENSTGNTLFVFRKGTN